MSGKSPYQRGNASRRGRGWMLVVTVVLLFIATAAWITTYTRSVQTAPIGAPQNPIDPAAR